ncbi:copper amine oxidase N-terminal domain protein [Peptoanaerobacter stomatis]|uniref:Copper amine oxidase N-terminal domain protein n=1 Tax=Peptoanaerobacter stomatis TaxID=796937 RepID=J5UPG4_9FIRM|nr:stalk domain-containing protein [Peptoanaerobacter stomatis]EJU24104.1 copper amine oxidase N-terminal domain protein [Peptoanaerobacter stomatis]NWO24196.1 copper amine oxidase [Peptostreptococcaceae bacterium oral taxon 081]
MFKANYFKKLCSILTAFVLCAGMMVHISFAYGIDDYDVFLSSFKTDATQNNPKGYTSFMFEITKRYSLKSITTYHWNNGRGMDPGTISLYDDKGNSIGSWNAEARGSSGAQKVNWDVFPDIIIEPGQYYIYDSSPETWSSSVASNFIPFVELKGIQDNSSSSQITPKETNDDNSNGSTANIPKNADLRTFNGHTYLIVSESVTPEVAEKRCKEMGGYLATITSESENDFLKTLFSEQNAIAYIIGGTDREQEGEWKWMNGEAWSFTYWNSPIEPNNGLGRGENYLIAARAESWKWVDFFGGYDNYSTTFPFVCEWSSELPSAKKVSENQSGTVGENLLKNPSFEEGLSYWVEAEGTWNSQEMVENERYKAVHGKYLVWSPQNNPCIYQDVSLSGYNAGQTVELSTQSCNWDQNPPDESQIVLKFLDNSDNVIKQSKAQGSKSSWYRLNISERMPVGAVKARVELWGIRKTGETDAYFDDVSLTVGGNAKPASQINEPVNKPTPTETKKPANTGKPAENKAVPIEITDGTAKSTTSAFNGVTGVTVDFKRTGAIGYRLYRSESEDSLGISVTDFYITSTNFTDVNAEPNTTYYYTLKEILAEADPLNGKREEIGDTLARWKTTTSEFIGQGFKNKSATRHFIMLKIDDPKMSVDGIIQEVDPGKGTAPIVLRGRTVVPIRAIVEAMDGTVGWEYSTQEVSLKASGNSVKMWINKKQLVKNGKNEKMDIEPKVINARTFVPLRFGAENLNCQVDWINSTNSIIIVWSE